jgi:tripartite-type tricarboxylate transporter receptor subunit TctC
MIHMPRRALLGLAAALPVAAHAQAPWRPRRPVQLWIVSAPGGAVDVLARAVASRVERLRGWSLVPVNRTGGAGVVMATALRSAPADGHVLGVTVSSSLVLPAVTMNPAPYALEDFASVARLARLEFAVVTRTDGPLGSVEDLRALAQRRGQVTVAAQGSEVVLGVRALGRHLGIDIEPIPVRGGAEGMTQLMGDHVDAAVLAGVQVTAVREGGLREIVALGAAPTQLTPSAPTLKGLGLDVAVEAWFQVIAPRGIPPAALDAHAAAIGEALADPEIRSLASERLSLVLEFHGPQETAARTQQEAVILRRLHEEFDR